MKRWINCSHVLLMIPCFLIRVRLDTQEESSETMRKGYVKSVSSRMFPELKGRVSRGDWTLDLPVCFALPPTSILPTSLYTAALDTREHRLFTLEYLYEDHRWRWRRKRRDRSLRRNRVCSPANEGGKEGFRKDLSGLSEGEVSGVLGQAME